MGSASTQHCAEPDRHGRVPASASARDPGLRPAPLGHHHIAPVVCLLRHRARHPPRAHPRRHRPPHRSLANPAGPQPLHGPRRRRSALPVSHPRPRHHVHRRLRRRLHRRRRPHHQDTGAGTAGQRDRRTLRRLYPPRAPRPDPDHQRAARRCRAATVRNAITTTTGHTAPSAKLLPYDPSPTARRPRSTTFDDGTGSGG